MHARRLARPLSKGLRSLRSDGPRGLAQRAVRIAHQRLDVASLDEALLPDDVADSERTVQAPPPPPLKDGPATIGWLTTPPALGSGGHTTMFRMVRALEQAGHRCVLYLYDRYGGDTAAQADVIRQGWPEVAAEVRSVREGLRGVDACVATSWQTAHVLARHASVPVHRFYFVQDFEPYFYPRGSEYALAEDSYRLGHRGIALGHMVAGALSDIGVDSEVVPFGCDTDVYRLLHPAAERRGVVFYTRPGVGRRGYLLGKLALEAFHARHPEHEIHVYGAAAPGLRVPVTHHGRLTPEGLNRLYNQVVAGLALSFTNISLVAEEMLAAGCVPVVNESPLSRADLDNPWARWAPPTPQGLADGLSAAVESASDESAREAGASVRGRSWELTQKRVVDIIDAVVRAG